jgi:hypothetical protein
LRWPRGLSLQQRPLISFRGAELPPISERAGSSEEIGAFRA